MKARSPLVLVLLGIGILVNVIALGVGFSGGDGFTPTMAINGLFLLMLIPFLVLELMKPKG